MIFRVIFLNSRVWGSLGTSGEKQKPEASGSRNHGTWLKTRTSTTLRLSGLSTPKLGEVRPFAAEARLNRSTGCWKTTSSLRSFVQVGRGFGV